MKISHKKKYIQDHTNNQKEMARELKFVPCSRTNDVNLMWQNKYVTWSALPGFLRGKKVKRSPVFGRVIICSKRNTWTQTRWWNWPTLPAIFKRNNLKKKSANNNNNKKVCGATEWKRLTFPNPELPEPARRQSGAFPLDSTGVSCSHGSDLICLRKKTLRSGNTNS